MAYEYLYDCTKEMMDFVEKEEKAGRGGSLLSLAFVFYYQVLSKPKFKSQRYYFQRRFADLNMAYAVGAFGTLKSNQINPSVYSDIKEFKKNRNEKT